MDELLQRFNAANVRYLLIGGQAMRLLGMPRFSMDWDFFLPARDEENFRKINNLLEDELDLRLEQLGRWGENFIQTYQTRWGILQFHLIVPGVPNFDKSEATGTILHTENGTPVPCLRGFDLLSSKEASNRPQDQADIEFLRELQKVGKI